MDHSLRETSCDGIVIYNNRRKIYNLPNVQLSGKRWFYTSKDIIYIRLRDYMKFYFTRKLSQSRGNCAILFSIFGRPLGLLSSTNENKVARIRVCLWYKSIQLVTIGYPQY